MRGRSGMCFAGVLGCSTATRARRAARPSSSASWSAPAGRRRPVPGASRGEGYRRVGTAVLLVHDLDLAAVVRVRADPAGDVEDVHAGRAEAAVAAEGEVDVGDVRDP